jgi:hypothetical protein
MHITYIPPLRPRLPLMPAGLIIPRGPGLATHWAGYRIQLVVTGQTKAG